MKAICCNSNNDTEIIELVLHYWYWPAHDPLAPMERAQAAKSGKQAANDFSCFSAWTVNAGARAVVMKDCLHVLHTMLFDCSFVFSWLFPPFPASLPRSLRC